MNEDNWFYALMFAVVVIPLLTMGFCAYTDHIEKMECMKQQAMWVRGSCIFTDKKPQ